MTAGRQCRLYPEHIEAVRRARNMVLALHDTAGIRDGALLAQDLDEILQAWERAGRGTDVGQYHIEVPA